jgi:hypothetical protein
MLHLVLQSGKSAAETVIISFHICGLPAFAALNDGSAEFYAVKGQLLFKKALNLQL